MLLFSSFAFINFLITGIPSPVYLSICPLPWHREILLKAKFHPATMMQDGLKSSQ
jgi:hypothetical protein